MKNTFFKLFLFIFIPAGAIAQDWSRNAEVHSPRDNIYQLDDQNFAKKTNAGKKHALFYPVSVSDLLIPYQPLKTFFDSEPDGAVRQLIFKLAKVVSPFKDFDDVYKWLGVHDFPLSVQNENPNSLPTLTETEKSLPMGATLMQTDDGEALTFSCAACHTGDLFGVKVLGLTNRFPRANEFFRQGQRFAPYVNSFIFRDLLQATEGERLLMVRMKNAVKWVGAKEPTVLGLDTSLAQVALSLAKRKKDGYATRTELSHRFPRSNKLEKMVADSKPAVWWNVKYKNRWLSDGSIVSGNPVHTNFLWNEIGRGTDLVKLEKWMQDSDEKIQELTAAVFATKAPSYMSFFGEKAINRELAMRGEKHFVASCQGCHGTYQKDWDKNTLTTKVIYHKKTPVIDVGTDPGRYLGMKEFSDDLNRLEISKSIGTMVEPQKGYVPPPLVGIWARWPYFHNNSLPNLCALLTKSSERPKTYWAGKAEIRERDYDQECAGYPIGEKTPEHWKKDKDYFYDTNKEGLSNKGHDEKIFLKDGKEIYTQTQKLELIEFLKTL